MPARRPAPAQSRNVRALALACVALAALLYGAYWLAHAYAMQRFAEHLKACTTTAMQCQLAQQRSSIDLTATMRRTYACARDKQSWIERQLVPVADLRAPGVTLPNLGLAPGPCP